MKELIIAGAIIAGSYGIHVYAAGERDRLEGVLSDDPNYRYSLQLRNYQPTLDQAVANLKIRTTEGDGKRYLGPALPAKAREQISEIVLDMGDVEDLDDRLTEVIESLPDTTSADPKADFSSQNQEFADQRAIVDSSKYELGLLVKKYRWRAPNDLVTQRDLASAVSVATKITGIGTAGITAFLGGLYGIFCWGEDHDRRSGRFNHRRSNYHGSFTIFGE